MELSRGEYIGIVNSDDTYRPNALSIISSYIDNNENIDFIWSSGINNSNPNARLCYDCKQKVISKAYKNIV